MIILGVDIINLIISYLDLPETHCFIVSVPAVRNLVNSIRFNGIVANEILSEFPFPQIITKVVFDYLDMEISRFINLVYAIDVNTFYNMPQSVKHVTAYMYSNEKIEFPKLLSLKLFVSCNVIMQFPDTLTSLCLAGYQGGKLQIANLRLTYLKLRYCDCLFDAFPKTLQSLTIYGSIQIMDETIPKVTTLKLINGINKFNVLNNITVYPDSIEKLYTYSNGIKLKQLPANIKHLKISTGRFPDQMPKVKYLSVMYNNDNVDLPETETLEIMGSVTRKVKYNLVQTIIISTKNFWPDQWPATFKILHIQANCQCNVKNLPEGLEHIYIYKYFTRIIEKFPSTLKTIHIYNHMQWVYNIDRPEGLQIILQN